MPATGVCTMMICSTTVMTRTPRKMGLLWIPARMLYSSRILRELSSLKICIKIKALKSSDLLVSSSSSCACRKKPRARAHSSQICAATQLEAGALDPVRSHQARTRGPTQQAHLLGVFEQRLASIADARARGPDGLERRLLKGRAPAGLRGRECVGARLLPVHEAEVVDVGRGAEGLLRVAEDLALAAHVVAVEHLGRRKEDEQHPEDLIQRLHARACPSQRHVRKARGRCARIRSSAGCRNAGKASNADAPARTCTIMCFHMVRLMSGASRPCGLWLSSETCGFSVASASAANVSMIRLTHLRTHHRSYSCTQMRPVPVSLMSGRSLGEGRTGAAAR